MVSFWPRINTVLLLVTLLTVIGLFATRAFGGPLDPPGAPASTPGGIDGRIPISSLPFTISTAGSYVVTKDLPGTGVTGITVEADNVTIDLNGFTLDGVDYGVNGIHAANRSNVSVFNGVMRRWSTGIYNAGGAGGLFHRLQIDDSAYGVYLGNGARLDASILRNNSYGAAVFGDGVTITDSTFLGNGTAIYDANWKGTLIESNHIDIPDLGIGVTAGAFMTIRRNYFGHPALTGYTTIALGAADYVVIIENRMKASLTTGGTGTGLYIPYDVNNALTNVSP